MDDIEAIKQLKARYCRTMDTKDWEAMRRLFTDDVATGGSETGGRTATGAERLMSVVIHVIGEATTVHHCHSPEIELTSPTTAAGIWAMEDMLWFPDGRHRHGYGHYHETYEKQDGAWRIASLLLERLRLDETPAPGS